MDAAEPLFDESNTTGRLDASDALFVQGIHTSIYGVQYPIGDADYYANDGVNQPGCYLGPLGNNF